MCQLNVEFKGSRHALRGIMANTIRVFAMIHTVDLVPSASHFWMDGTRRVPTTLLMYLFILKCGNIPEKPKTK